MKRHSIPSDRASALTSSRHVERGDVPRPRGKPLAERLPADSPATAGTAQLAGGVAVIVPTRNEADNVVPLLTRLEAALVGTGAEVLFVDDSDDDTPARIRAAALTSRMPVRLHHRCSRERLGGLGGAVVAGLEQNHLQYAVVMDGDLQHPPEVIPALLRRVEVDDLDVVVASRHVEHGSASGLSGPVRSGVSNLSTLLTRSLFPRRLRQISDPMSGFFVLRRGAIDLDSLRPDGFKILLEILARTPDLRVGEVGFTFADRQAGDSKASLREGGRFLRQVWRLWRQRAADVARARAPGRYARGAGFLLVGLSGLVVNSLLLWSLVELPGIAANYVIAAILATQGSSTWNFVWIDRLVYRGPKRLSTLRRGVAFLAMSNLMLLFRIPLMALLVTFLGMHYLLANAISLAVGFAARFSAQERITVRREDS